MNVSETTIVSRLSLTIIGLDPAGSFRYLLGKHGYCRRGVSQLGPAHIFAMIAFILGEPEGERLAAVIDPDAAGRLIASVVAICEPTTENLR